MKKTELILNLLIIAGAILKIFHIPGGGIISTLSFQTLAIFYLFALMPLCSNMTIKDAYQKVLKEDKKYWRFAGTFITAWIFSTILLGLLFKIQFWKGAQIMLTVGLVSLILPLIISAIKLVKSKDDYYLNLLRRILGLGIVAFVVFNIPNVNLMKFINKNTPLEYIQAYEDYLTYPDSTEVYDKFLQEREKLRRGDYRNTDSEESVDI